MPSITTTGCTPATSVRVRTAPVELVEDERGFRVFADVPGADPDSIEITVEDGVLRIEATRPARTRDRPEITFRRAFRLADEIDVDGIEARCEHGVLVLDVPRVPEAAPRRIPVRTVG